VIYFGDGFAFAFCYNIVKKKIENPLLVDITYAMFYTLGLFLVGHFIEKGRRLTLIISDCFCLLVLLLLVISNDTVDFIIYFLVAFINGIWMPAVFIYAKDLSVIQQPAFVVLFCQAMNYTGVLLANIAQILLDNSSLDRELLSRILFGAGLGLPCIIQLMAFFIFIKKEPVRYLYATYEIEDSCKGLREMFDDTETVEKVINLFLTSSSNRKIIGTGYTSLFKKFYRKALLTCLGLFLFKATSYILSYKKRIPDLYDNTYMLLNQCMKIILTIGLIFVVNKVQHKTLLYIGYLTTLIGNNIISILVIFYIFYTDIIGLPLMLAIFSVEFVWCFFLTNMPYIYALELLPDKGISFMIMIYGLTTNIFGLTINNRITTTNPIRWLYYPIAALISLGALVFIHKVVKYTEEINEEDTKRAYFNYSAEDLSLSAIVTNE